MVEYSDSRVDLSRLDGLLDETKRIIDGFRAVAAPVVEEEEWEEEQ